MSPSFDVTDLSPPDTDPSTELFLRPAFLNSDLFDDLSGC